MLVFGRYMAIDLPENLEVFAAMPKGRWVVVGYMFPPMEGMSLQQVFERANIQASYLANGGSEDKNPLVLENIG